MLRHLRRIIFASTMLAAFSGSMIFVSSTFAQAAEPAPVVLFDAPRQLVQGERLVITGVASPNALVTIAVTAEGGVQDTQSVLAGADGRFSAVWPYRPAVGQYTIAMSESTSPEAATPLVDMFTFEVVPKQGFAQLGTRDLLLLLLPTLALAIFVVILIANARRLLHEMQKEVTEADRAAKEVFETIKKDVKQRKPRAKIVKDLETGEAQVEKEIRDIKKTVRRSTKTPRV